MRTFYLDNAATTRIDPLVVAAMRPYWQSLYGNASMSYQLGNTSKVALEESRRLISDIIGASDGHVFFTSGGTEANNWALCGLVEANGIQHVITSPIEHKSVLAPLDYLAKKGRIILHWLPIDSLGHVDLQALPPLLKKHKHVLVTLMHGNNEIGNITDIRYVGQLCQQYGALFHTDVVQTIGYYDLDVATLPIAACTASAHKFHGPKGIGFVYIRNDVPFAPLLYGGNQEKGLRPGTENIPLIVGMAKALSIAHAHRDAHRKQIAEIKKRFIQQLASTVSAIHFHGACAQNANSLPTIVNLSIPTSQYKDILLVHLDTEGIQASSGSACMSGTQLRSHVVEALGINPNHTVLRFSLSKYNHLDNVPIWTKKIATLLSRYSIHI